MVLVAFDHATVGQDELRPQQVVAGQAVLAAEDSQAAAEGEAGDPDRGTAAGGNGQAMGGQRVIELAEPHAGTHGRHVPRDRHRAHGPGVEDNPVGRGPPGNRVPAVPDHRRQAKPTRDGKGRGYVRGGRAQDDGRRPQMLKARHHGLAHRLVVGRARQDDVAIDRPSQRTPVGGHGRTLPETTDRSALVGCPLVGEQPAITRHDVLAHLDRCPGRVEGRPEQSEHRLRVRTKTPRPCSLRTRPSFLSTSIAWRAVIRVTP
jgi:hypothetical protein